MDWFEAISENYMDTGGRPLHILEKVRRHYPVALHGTSLSVGSIDPLHPGYLTRLKKLVERIDPFLVSDHLCWSAVQGEALHDLLPLPLTEEAIQHVVRRVDEIQEFLGRRILLENVSTYVTYRHSTLPEWEFLTQVVKRSGCGILLDLNNLYVNAVNHRFNSSDYLENIPGELVGQFHLAGHTDMGSFLFDTHSAPVIDPVWELYRKALGLWGPVSTLIEWDEAIPPYSRLAEEAERARAIYREFKEKRDGSPRDRCVVEAQVSPPEPSVSLSEVQQWMKSRIQPFSQNLASSASDRPLLNPQGGVTGEERMEVYAKGYRARIRESLAEVYEGVHHVLGSERFDELSELYARRYPSHNYNLNYAGRHLPELLPHFSASRSLPFLSDLAKLEWLVWEAFHSFDGAPLQPSQIQEIPMEEWENMKIVFQPSVRLITSDWPILDLWLARHRRAGEPPLDWVGRPQRVLVGRKEDQVRCELLDSNQYRLLEGLLAGKSLGQACEELAEVVGEKTPPLQEWFSRWIQAGLLLSLVPGPLKVSR